MGVMKCPECGFAEAQVKRQKNGLAYRFCPVCAAQYFPRTVEASERLIAASVPVTGTEAAGAVPDSPAPPTTSAPPVAERRGGFRLGGL